MPHCFPPNSSSSFKIYITARRSRVWERHAQRLCFYWWQVCSHQSQPTAGDEGWARDSVYPQVRPACWASLGARWPQCQQAGPGLMKDVEPNWSCQHLLLLHFCGWRQSLAQWEDWPWGEACFWRPNTPYKRFNGQSASKEISPVASVSNIKQTVHSLSINMSVISLSASQPCCHFLFLFLFFSSVTV